MSWVIEDSETDLAEIIQAAEQNGPQKIIRDNQEIAVILSISDFRKMDTSKLSLVDFFRHSPLADAEIDLNHDRN